MGQKSASYNDNLMKWLQDPEKAAEYIKAAIEDGDKALFLLALRQVAQARGGMAEVAEKAHPTDKGLVTLTLQAPKALAPSIRKYADELMKEESGDSIPWREAFSRQFEHETIAAVCLQSARTTKGLTQKRLAELADIPQRHISEMETGKRNIGKERAIRLAKVLDTDYRILL